MMACSSLARQEAGVGIGGGVVEFLQAETRSGEEQKESTIPTTPTVAARRQRTSWPRTRITITTTRPTIMSHQQGRIDHCATSFLERRRW